MIGVSYFSSKIDCAWGASIFISFILIFAFFHQKSFAINYHLGVEGQYYPQKINDIRSEDVIVDLGFDYSKEFSEHHRLKLSPNLQSNLVADDHHEQFFVNASEFFWEIRLHPLRIRLGLETFSWGISDGFSPMDVVGTRNYSDPLDSQRIGQPSLHVAFESGSFKTDIIYLPVLREGVLPGYNSRWLPREFLVEIQGVDGKIIFPDGVEYRYQKHQAENKALNNNFGIRLKYRKSDFDFHAMGFIGAAPTPSMGVTYTGTIDDVSEDKPVVRADPLTILTPVYYLQRTAGLGVVWAPQHFILRMESAYTHTLSPDIDVKRWSHSHALSLEKNLNLGSSTLTIYVQGTYSQHEQKGDNLAEFNTRIFDQAVLYGVNWSPSLDFVISLKGLGETTSGGHFVSGGMTYRLIEGTKVGLSYESIKGPDKSLIGSFSKNDRGLISLFSDF